MTLGAVAARLPTAALRQTKHFGLVMMTCVTFGSMTPPVGVAMFTVCGLLGCSMDEYTREAIPFFIAIVLLVLLMVFVPGVVLFLPNLLM